MPSPFYLQEFNINTTKNYYKSNYISNNKNLQDNWIGAVPVPEISGYLTLWLEEYLAPNEILFFYVLVFCTGCDEHLSSVVNGLWIFLKERYCRRTFSPLSRILSKYLKAYKQHFSSTSKEDNFSHSHQWENKIQVFSIITKASHPQPSVIIVWT